tara:strand:+ start:638 stop:811 length:174 start_codon:yes stop_codon:yes gene_type:complete
LGDETQTHPGGEAIHSLPSIFLFSIAKDKNFEDKNPEQKNNRQKERTKNKDKKKKQK